MYRIIMCLCLGVVLAGCGDTTLPPADASISCGVGQKVAYKTDTGQPYCVDDVDGGQLADSTILLPDGNTVPADIKTGDTGTPGKDGADTKGSDSTDTAIEDSGPVTKTTGFECPPDQPQGNGGGKHGQTCVKDSDCLYGACVFNAPLAGYDKTIGFCTKNCACPSPLAVCSKEDGGGVAYTCTKELTITGGNPKRVAGAPPQQMCARTCKTDAECSAWNPEMPDCIKNSTKYISVGTTGACGKNPLK